ncbi:5-carboxymethyl-2-hydroxymuconate Delta-isomerase [Antarctobacter jejuensis]|uniref:5-carboxymethyl-2-hydroxymuconate Delta-isomerase n=1 Tax=Antarctobacter jejuensis TaxID=1439938 RepID=UPI003FCEFF3C
MPHLRLEYSPGVEDMTDLDALCGALHAAMVSTGVFPAAGVRVKAIRCDYWRMADRHPENHFVGLELSVGSGRPKVVLTKAGEAIFDVAKSSLAPLLEGGHFALAMEIREIDPDLNWKANPIHDRMKSGA